MSDFLLTKCKFSVFDAAVMSHSQPFACGDSDLDDFFANDSENYNRQLLGKSYCFRLLEDEKVIVCTFTLSNSSIESRHLPNSRKKKLIENIPHEKMLSSYPATLIGRLGVNQIYLGKGIGTELMEFIKLWLLENENRTACRFLTVDAYNKEGTLKFYEKNGFKYLFSTEQQEKEYIGMAQLIELKTRLMYFDLLNTKR
ncbi:MAG: GNAT family N-acetyltransferase [Tannerella sp.]|jgi:GNAT superfamily N-acetyltransferase|nr:GNAT family N-acetyltransferase [Tannerella sp.]